MGLPLYPQCKGTTETTKTAQQRLQNLLNLRGSSLFVLHLFSSPHIFRSLQFLSQSSPNSKASGAAHSQEKLFLIQLCPKKTDKSILENEMKTIKYVLSTYGQIIQHLAETHEDMGNRHKELP